MLFITTSVFELTLSSVLSFFQCDLSCCLYILHIPWCILMSYTCLSELHFELHFELSPIEFDLSHAKKRHKDTRSLVEVLHHYIGIWAHFELCLELFPMWFQLLPLHTTYKLMHLDVLYMFVWAHFELSPQEFELSYAQKHIHKHMCTFVGVLHHYIGIWAHFELCLELFPMWFELLPLHTTYTLMHLDILYVFVWASFWASFWASPTGIWAIPCKKNKHTCSLVEALHHDIDIWAHFELCLELFPMWFELLPLHTLNTFVSYTCLFEPILSLILSFPHWNLSYPMQNKNIHKHMCAFVAALHHYIDIWAHFELCLELFPMWFELLPLHTTYTLVHLDVLYVFVWAHFELHFELSPLEFALSHAKKIHKHTCS